MAKTLIQTNPWLRDPETRRRTIERSVASSSAIEGIRAPFRKGRRVKRSPALVRFIRLLQAESVRLDPRPARSRAKKSR